MAQRARGQTTSQPTKKMVIKPFKAKPKLPEQFEETTWAKLHSAVQAIHQHQTVSQSMQELYQAVQDLCLHNLAASCFSRLQTLCEDHITLMITKLVGQTPDPVEFLNLMEECWDDHVNQMTTIRHVFMYLDRSYVLQNAPVRSLWDMGLQLFRKHLGAFEDVERKLVTGILTLIERERAGDTVNRSQLRNLLRMLSAIGTYGDQFEGAFLSATSSFYAEESRRTRDTCDIPDFLRYVDRRLAEENERVNNYLDPNTRRALIAAAERELLEEHVDAIIDKGFDSLMDDNRHADLARMYSHLQRVNALGQLRVSFTAYVKRSGGEIVTNEETDKDMVENLLVFKAKLDFVLTEAFENNDDLGHALKDAFESFINIRQNKPAELIAKFIDAKLKSGNKASSAEEVEVILDRVMVIFRHIQGKDVFEAFFKKDLAKRLLMGKSASIDAEKSMISKLKQQCGSTFTNKLEGMFKDIDLSRDVMLSFKENAAMKARLSDFDISVHVLTTGFWPPYQPAPLNLPKQLADAQDVFQFFYLSKHSGRRLVWQHSLGHSTLRARFPLGQKELLVSAYQTVVLLLFNDTESLSFPDIKEATAMDDKELRVTLQSLACGKIRVLRKNPKGRDIHDGDTFTFNTEFHNKLLRIKINSIQMKETTEENQSTTERVFQDRQYQIDAAVVRVMKARKSLQHQLLISELYKQLKFPVAVRPSSMTSHQRAAASRPQEAN